jgi:hypothetical protein
MPAFQDSARRIGPMILLSKFMTARLSLLERAWFVLGNSRQILQFRPTEWVMGLQLTVHGLWFTAQGSGFRVHGSWFMVHGLWVHPWGELMNGSCPDSLKDAVKSSCIDKKRKRQRTNQGMAYSLMKEGRANKYGGVHPNGSKVRLPNYKFLRVFSVLSLSA